MLMGRPSLTSVLRVFQVFGEKAFPNLGAELVTHLAMGSLELGVRRIGLSTKFVPHCQNELQWSDVKLGI